MPADDLVLAVRQIAGYPPAVNAVNTDAVLIQRGGLGGAYMTVDAATLVATALAAPGENMTVGGALSAISFQGGSAQFSNAYANVLGAQTACIQNFSAANGSINGVPIATVNDIAAQAAATVNSFNGRIGNVVLWIDDIRCAGGAPIYAPRFTGDPRADTPPPWSNSSRLATTAFVQGTVAQLTLDYAPLDSPNFTGVPTAPTAALGSSDGQLATTAFVQNAVASGVAGVASFNTRTGAVVLTAADLTGAGGALLASPTFTGIPASPTAAPGTNTTQLATTAFVMNAVNSVVSGVSSFNSRTGAVTLNSTDITGAGGALAASSVASFNGRTGAVNLLANDISGASGALLTSPAFTGTPTAPTPPPGDSSTRLATTAFIATLSGFAPLASPAFTGVPTAPTATVGTNTTQLATTAFVAAAIAGSTAGVSSFNSRTGAVTLLANDLSSAGGALLASPAFTGTPSAPTAALGVSTTQLATCAYVTNAIGALSYLPLAGGVVSGNLTVGGSLTSPNGLVTSGDVAYTSTGMTFDGGPTFAAQWDGSIYLNWIDDGEYFGALVFSMSNPEIGITQIGSIQLTPENSTVYVVVSGSSWAWPVTFSDPKLKTNSSVASKDALAAIMSVPVYEFDLALPGTETIQHWDWGFFAEPSLGELIPNSYIPAPAAAGGGAIIRELPIVAALVRAVQQLVSRVETLEARIAT